ncbi:MAG: sulfite exporter TauE/SafE family protein, partial [Candidatus Thorarchaeota archaeon]|nr:sulfite exporter TauE/SafE family protein [Candidatus Thorarchaeota archaeon]
MQDVLIDVLLIAAFAVAVGTISSMTGIGGGIINTPLLIIIFGLTAQTAPATALVAALFVAVASTVTYYRQNPRPIIFKPGIFLAITTVPGSLAGVALREFILEDYILRIIFGIALFPVALKMLFAKKRGKSDDVASFNFSEIPRSRIGLAIAGGFIGGISAGLLGIGGGAIVVPVLTMLMGLPIHAAVATSMFIMMFTASAGTARNFIGGHIDPFYALALGIGMVIGAQIGPRFACKVNAVQLKQVFGLVLVFPLVKMMYLGQMLLD